MGVSDTLVPVSHAGDLSKAPGADQRPNHGRSALDDFLDRARAHERMGGFVSPFLFRSALAADAFLLVLLLIGSQISSGGVSHSRFFLIGGGLVGGLIGLMQALTWPLLAIALLGVAWAASRGHSPRLASPVETDRERPERTKGSIYVNG